MPNQSKHLCLLTILVSLGLASAARAADGDEVPGHRPFAISAEAGTTGAGASGAWRFSNHFGARAGLHYFEDSLSKEIEGVNYDARLRLLSEPLTFDLYPWKKSSFRISLGALLNQNRLSGSRHPPTCVLLDRT